jgi:peptide/nickel transport system substrate-binding protein
MAPSIRTRFLFGTLLLLAGCGEEKSGPIEISAIGGQPTIVNPSRQMLDMPGAYLIENAAQGLVGFDQNGEIVPRLAQSWVISDDGLRYTFRIARGSKWQDGAPVTADEVVARLRAAAATSSRNPLRPLLGAIDEIVRMTDDVLEIDLKAPRPNFLQLLAQPEFGMVRGRIGSGPYRAAPQRDGTVLLTLPPPEDEDDEAPRAPAVVLRGEAAPGAIARFDLDESALVLGGTAADLPFAQAIDPAPTALQLDPVDGLFGLAFVRPEGPLAAPEVRQALAMAIDRGAALEALGLKRMQPRETLLPTGIEGLNPAAAAWTSTQQADRRATARRVLNGQHLTVHISLPDGPGFRLLFAYLRRDLAAIGVAARRVGPGEAADLVLIDEVAPAGLASWYLRHFTCDRSAVCSSDADALLDQARLAPNAGIRRGLLANADRLLTDSSVYIPLSAPVRWSLVAPRLTGFKPNAFGHHPAGGLIAEGP